MAAIIATRDLTKSFAGLRAVDGISLEIEEGALHAIIGPNGAGKTTFFNLLSGFVVPTSGTIGFRDQDITGRRPEAIARLGIVRSFQINSIFAHLSLLDNVKVSLQSRTRLAERLFFTAIARACGCPMITTSFFPLVTPV